MKVFQSGSSTTLLLEPLFFGFKFCSSEFVSSLSFQVETFAKRVIDNSLFLGIDLLIFLIQVNQFGLLAPD